MAECIFCKIANGEIPVKLLHQDERAVAFRDTNPQAPVHILVVPKEHVVSLAETTRAHAELLGHLLATAQEVAADVGLEQGFRVVINTREHGGQTVPHLHLHVLGGRHMGWPPG